MGTQTQADDLYSRLHNTHLSSLSQKTISKDIQTSMPSKMYFLPEIYELERRAIFSKHWFLVSHQARYKTIGDYVQYEIAGYNFVVTYHGWSYDLSGKLAKAPRFNATSVDGFDTAKYSLFPIHTHVDRNGFVYVNLDGKETPSVDWETQYGSLDQQEVLLSSGINWDAIEFDHTWSKEGQFNWKLMQDNYNECYHCLIAHPDVAKTTNLDTYHIKPGSNGTFISHFNEPKPSAVSPFDETRFAGRSATHVFPIGHFSPNPGTGFMHLMRSCPTSPTTTRQEYDIFKLHTPHATPEAHQRMLGFYQKVVQEDLDLCNAVQENLSRGVYRDGPLHPFYEEGVVAFPGMVMERLRMHEVEEKNVGREIWCAEPRRVMRDEDMKEGWGVLSCEVMACEDGSLAW